MSFSHECFHNIENIFPKRSQSEFESDDTQKSSTVAGGIFQKMWETHYKFKFHNEWKFGWKLLKQAFINFLCRALKLSEKNIRRNLKLRVKTFFRQKVWKMSRMKLIKTYNYRMIHQRVLSQSVSQLVNQDKQFKQIGLYMEIFVISYSPVNSHAWLLYRHLSVGGRHTFT